MSETSAEQIVGLDFPDYFDHLVALIRSLGSEANQRLWGCDVAEEAWRLYGAPRLPRERRPLVAIACARRYARGQETEADLANAWHRAVAVGDVVDVAKAAAWAASTGDRDFSRAMAYVALTAIPSNMYPIPGRVAQIVQLRRMVTAVHRRSTLSVRSLRSLRSSP